MSFKGLKRTASGTDEPLTLSMAKTHLRVSGAQDDTLISAQIAAAREFCEEYCGRSFVPSVWVLSLECFPDGAIYLPMGDVSEVNKVEYLNASGVWVEVSGCRIDLNGRIASISKPDAGWPSVLAVMDAVKVSYVAGPSNILTDNPKQLTAAMLLLVEHFYANRGAVITGMTQDELAFGVRSLLDQMKTGWVA